MILFSLQADEKINLSLYFRVTEETHKSTELNKDSIKLLINKTQREVINLAKKERSLSHIPDLGRNFILSFHITKFTKPMENSVSYFVEEILQPNDNLILLTPMKAYRISLSRDKEKLIMDATRLLKNDCMIYEKKRISAEKSLENEITKLSLALSNETEDPGGVQSYKAVYQFLLNYPKNLSHFKIEYLLPNIARHRQIREFLGEREGERWWIHFQNRENIRIMNKTKEVLKKIHKRTTYEGETLSRNMAKDLSDLEKQLVISDSFPQSEFLSTILGANISYNVIFWGSPKIGRSIQFTLNSFQLDQEEKYGMLKVRIVLSNQQNSPVFQTENILRASKESVTISIPLPEIREGDFRILISVFDLLANTSTFDEYPITFHI